MSVKIFDYDDRLVKWNDLTKGPHDEEDWTESITVRASVPNVCLVETLAVLLTATRSASRALSFLAILLA